jgi:hypothetical protein
MAENAPIFNSNTPRLGCVEKNDFMSKEFINKCPYCGSLNLDETSEKEKKCNDCGMGKYNIGKR